MDHFKSLWANYFFFTQMRNVLLTETQFIEKIEIYKSFRSHKFSIFEIKKKVHIKMGCKFLHFMLIGVLFILNYSNVDACSCATNSHLQDVFCRSETYGELMCYFTKLCHRNHHVQFLWTLTKSTIKFSWTTFVGTCFKYLNTL